MLLIGRELFNTVWHVRILNVNTRAHSIQFHNSYDVNRYAKREKNGK